MILDGFKQGTVSMSVPNPDEMMLFSCFLFEQLGVVGFFFQSPSQAQVYNLGRERRKRLQRKSWFVFVFFYQRLKAQKEEVWLKKKPRG